MQDGSAAIKKLAREGKCWEPAEKEFSCEAMPSGRATLQRPAVHRPPLLRLWGRGT